MVSSTSSFLSWSVELERVFYYVPHSLIDRTPWNDATSLTTYTTHTHANGHKNIYIYIYIYSWNPWESNDRNGPTGHKKQSITTYVMNLTTNCIYYTVTKQEFFIIICAKFSHKLPPPRPASHPPPFSCNTCVSTFFF